MERYWKCFKCGDEHYGDEEHFPKGWQMTLMGKEVFCEECKNVCPLGGGEDCGDCVYGIEYHLNHSNGECEARK